VDLAGGRAITVYGQQEVVKDLIAARLDSGGEIHFEAEATGVDAGAARVRFGDGEALRCAVVAGCDGFHGICRAAVPDGALTVFEREYPFAWLGILARAAPASEELIYTHHDRGFALHSMRSPEVTRNYLQVAPGEDLERWPDDRIWAELQTRMATDDGFALNEGEIFDKGITPMRSFVAEPMRHERLFLAGDAAHIVPATGAKGLNLAVADVRVLAHALEAFFEHGDESGLDAYSDRCLRRVWRVQHFSWFMTAMLHRMNTADPFEAKLQRSQLEYVVRSRAAATSLAENYVGLELEDV
jgi:p-hydroxybenzoate 3-monooxygenase